MALNLRLIGNTVRTALRLLDRLSGSAPGSSGAPAPRGKTASRRPTTAPRPGNAGGAAGAAGSYPGDFHGTATVRYAPSPNGLPEPGEVVWTWVPYEEDHTQGKDRPVLLVGSNGRYLLGLMLTSKDHDRDARRQDDYVDIGTGPWDRQSRPSEAKLDRILQIDPAVVRREGAILDAGRFSAVAAALRARSGWS
jgi:PemK-like, MazF-like toxin of type II toxin-antitoxin system